MKKPDPVDRVLIVPIGWMSIGSVLTRPMESIGTLDAIFFWLILVCMISFIIREFYGTE